MSQVIRAMWPAAATAARARVVIVGGPDVDLRIELMQALGRDFTLCALGTQPALGERFAAAGFGYRCYQIGSRTNPLADLRGLGQLVALLRRLHPQVVHTFATRPSVWGRLAARMAGVPVIIGTLPGLGTLYSGDSPRVRALRSIYRPLQRLACRISDRTIFQNVDDLSQFVGEGMVRPEQALIIPGSGVSTTSFNPDRISMEQRAVLRAELNLPPDAIVATMVSRVIRSKGVLEFMAAARQLAVSHPRLRFLLVGPHSAESLDRLSASELDALSQVVSWPGARRDIPQVLASSDIFVLPSMYREGMPRVLLEAAAMGLPAVTTDVPGSREVVIHEISGLLAPPGNTDALARSIVRLADDAELRRRYGVAARRRAVELFDVGVIAAQTGGLYRELLEMKGLQDSFFISS